VAISLIIKYNRQPDFLKVHKKVIYRLWRVRWWLILLAGLSAITTVYLIPFSGHDAGAPASEGLWIRLKFAILFSFLAVQLTAWFICTLKAIVLRQLKWVVSLLLFPPAAFLYLLINP
jgi:hypothetical protein